MIRGPLKWVLLSFILSSCASTVVRVDLTPPELNLTSALQSSEAAYVLKGKITDDSGIKKAAYQLNGGLFIPFTVQEDGTFAVNLTLQEGQNTLTLQASDTRDNLKTISVVLVYEKTLPAPVLTGILPAQGLEVGGTPLGLMGTHLESATQVLFDGVALPFEVTTEGQLNITSPAHQKGEVQVKVVTPAGTSNSLTYRYVPFGIRQFGSPGNDAVGALALDGQENIHLAWTGNGILNVTKLSNAGQVLWTWSHRTTEGSQSDALVNSMQVDADGNVYFCGNTSQQLPGSDSTGTQDGFAGKLSATGQLQWMKRIHSTTETATHLIVDEGNAVYVGGMTHGDLSGGADPGQRVYLIKYGLDGEQLWLKQLQKLTNQLAGLDLDATGNIYLLGQLLGAFPGYNNPAALDVFLMKLDSASNQLWVKQFAQFGNDVAVDMLLDDSGSIYAASHPQYEMPKVSKYDSEGTIVWTRTFQNPVKAITLDAQGALLVSSGPADLTRLLPDNKVDWTRSRQVPGPVVASKIRAGQSGNLYGGGEVNGDLPGYTSAGGIDAVVLKFNSDLTLPE